MEGTVNDSQAITIVSDNNLRIIQSNLQNQIEHFEDRFPETTFREISYICDIVKDQILDYEDEPLLSKSQNNCRRIYIASELFVSICSMYSLSIDYEKGKLINDLLHWEKYKNLSQKISYVMKKESKREKYFAKEALSKLLKSVKDKEKRNAEDERINHVNQIPSTEQERVEIGTQREVRESEAEIISRMTSVEKDLAEVTEASLDYEINKTLESPVETSVRPDDSGTFLANMTDIRGEILSDSFHVELPSSVPRQELLLPNMDGEISIGGPNIQQKTLEEINKILQVLEDQISTDIAEAEIEQPENILDTADKSPESSLKQLTIQNLPDDGESSEVVSENFDWRLQSLEPIKEIQKRHCKLIIDKETTIHDYSTKALRLNRNINIQRVQVFEGPPRILQAVSVNHLMTTPSHKSAVFQDVRSSKLSELYNRHLKVEKKPHKEQTFLQRRIVEEQRKLDFSKAETNGDITEVRGRAGMHSLVEKSAVLAEIPVEDLGGAPLPKESLVGVPVSRLIASAREFPEKAQMERINSAPILPSPRPQQLQGVSLEPKKANPPWFLSTKEDPPSDKFRSFKYVYEKLQKYWSLFESQRTEKCISMREFFSFEEETSVANFLTVLRVVDKLAIQRKLILELKKGDVFIRPFEYPYVSERQLLLKEKELIF